MDNGAAELRPLCAPSLGATIARFDWGTCGADGTDPGSTTVCEGDWLRTRYQGFKVPQVATGVEYHPIVRIVSTTDTDGNGIPQGGSTRTDWLPLRGTVTGC